MRAYELTAESINKDAVRLTESLRLRPGYYITEPGSPPRILDAAEYGEYYLGERDLLPDQWLYKIKDLDETTRVVVVMIDNNTQLEFTVVDNKIVDYSSERLTD